MSIELMHGDCLERMRELPDNSVDSIVTDPPYGISFMGKKWDYQIPPVAVWAEAMRVLKPGGHMLCACGTRTQHRMVCNIEDAGFEIRDVVTWLYGSGFPKSLNIGKAIDKAAGVEREVVGQKPIAYADSDCWGTPNKNEAPAGIWGNATAGYNKGGSTPITAPATEAAKQWDGWGTALKPACEFFTLARKPLSEKTVAANVLKWGTGGINIDGCRVGAGDDRSSGGLAQKDSVFQEGNQTARPTGGRFPANVMHDGSPEVVEGFPVTKSNSHGKAQGTKHESVGVTGFGCGVQTGHYDQGSAARFFYCAKASKKDRGAGNSHPTVKPTDLMRYLCRLITPPGGTVMDPFMGSGSTGKAAKLEKCGFIGVELSQEYFEIAQKRIGEVESTLF